MDRPDFDSMTYEQIREVLGPRETTRLYVVGGASRCSRIAAVYEREAHAYRELARLIRDEECECEECGWPAYVGDVMHMTAEGVFCNAYCAQRCAERRSRQDDDGHTDPGPTPNLTGARLN